MADQGIGGSGLAGAAGMVLPTLIRGVLLTRVSATPLYHGEVVSTSVNTGKVMLLS